MTKVALYSFLALSLTALYGLSHFTFNASASEPVGLYRITGHPPGRDALVLLKNPLKRLVGVPGDSIRTTAQGTWVNGRLIPNSGIPAAAPYRPYPFGTFKLAADQYWTLGQHPLSYDSRYEGPIPGSLIASRVEPFWTRP
jgi:type IV secretory pathway protease TraF